MPFWQLYDDSQNSARGLTSRGRVSNLHTPGAPETWIIPSYQATRNNSLAAIATAPSWSRVISRRPPRPVRIAAASSRPPATCPMPLLQARRHRCLQFRQHRPAHRPCRRLQPGLPVPHPDHGRHHNLLQPPTHNSLRRGRQSKNKPSQPGPHHPLHQRQRVDQPMRPPKSPPTPRPRKPAHLPGLVSFRCCQFCCCAF